MGTKPMKLQHGLNHLVVGGKAGIGMGQNGLLQMACQCQLSLHLPVLLIQFSLLLLKGFDVFHKEPALQFDEGSHANQAHETAAGFRENHIIEKPFFRPAHGARHNIRYGIVLRDHQTCGRQMIFRTVFVSFGKVPITQSSINSP